MRCGRRWPPMTRCCAGRSRRTAASCSSTPATVCVPRSPRRGLRSMPLSPPTYRTVSFNTLSNDTIPEAASSATASCLASALALATIVRRTEILSMEPGFPTNRLLHDGRWWAHPRADTRTHMIPGASLGTRARRWPGCHVIASACAICPPKPSDVANAIPIRQLAIRGLITTRTREGGQLVVEGTFSADHNTRPDSCVCCRLAFPRLLRTGYGAQARCGENGRNTKS